MPVIPRPIISNNIIHIGIYIIILYLLLYSFFILVLNPEQCTYLCISSTGRGIHHIQPPVIYALNSSNYVRYNL